MVAQAKAPHGYPTELESSIILADGRQLSVRPIVPEDAPHLRAEFDSADDETLRLRFLTPNPQLDEHSLNRLVTVDYRWRLALTAWDGAEPVAIARYEGKADSASAEVAFVVKPSYRRLGVARGLLALLEKAAVAAGISEFTATFLASNPGATGVLTRSGFAVPTIHDGIGETAKRLS